MTPRQRATLEAIHAHAERTGHPPRYTDLRPALGLSSNGTLHVHIRALVRAGLVHHEEGCIRDLRLTGAGLAALGVGTAPCTCCGGTGRVPVATDAETLRREEMDRR